MTAWQFFKRLSIELPYDAAILEISKRTENMPTQKCAHKYSQQHYL